MHKWFRFFIETSRKSRPHAGFGFIEPADGSEDLFAHQRQYTGDQNSIQDGMKVGKTAGNSAETTLDPPENMCARTGTNWPSSAMIYLKWWIIGILSYQRANGDEDRFSFEKSGGDVAKGSEMLQFCVKCLKCRNDIDVFGVSWSLYWRFLGICKFTNSKPSIKNYDEGEWVVVSLSI